MHTQILFLTSQFPIVKPRRKRKNPKKTILININSVRKKRATTKKKKNFVFIAVVCIFVKDLFLE